MMAKNIEPQDINIDVERGFTGFQNLYGIDRRDESLVLEQFVALSQARGAWQNISVQDFFALTTEGRQTLVSLIKVGYVQVDEARGEVSLTEGFIKRAYSFFPIGKARTPEEQAAFERQKILSYVSLAISKDTDHKVAFLIIPRDNDHVTKVMEDVDLQERLDKYNRRHLLDRGYALIDFYVDIDRDEPLEDQLPTIEWRYPDRRGDKPS